ncbi:MAG: cupin domain-containing protein [Deltaproteobacteria bacterium]|nr:cupin domain-containing protein [Deltaproteobacteria bacterium]
MYEDGGFLKWLEIFRDIVPNKTLPPGMSRRCVTLGDVMLALHEAFPNLETEDHTHESAQIACIIKGKMAVSIDGQKQCMGPGEFAYIPAGVPHHVQTFDEYALVLDIFSPPRSDIQERVAEITESQKK